LVGQHRWRGEVKYYFIKDYVGRGLDLRLFDCVFKKVDDFFFQFRLARERFFKTRERLRTQQFYEFFCASCSRRIDLVLDKVVYEKADKLADIELISSSGADFNAEQFERIEVALFKSNAQVRIFCRFFLLSIIV
jgi:hypothetical protein